MVKMGKRLSGIAMLLAIGVLLFGLASATQAADSVTLTGVLQDTDDGLVLQVGADRYLVEGNVPDWLVGNQVKVTGTVETDNEGLKYFIIEDFEEVQQ